MKKILIFSFLMFGLSTYAQQDDSRVEAAKKEFLIKEMELTPQEAEAFFPIYSEYNQKRKEARKSLRAERKNMSGTSEGSIDKIIDMEQSLIDLQKEYLEKFRKVLPEKKIVLLIESEKKFKAMMMQRLKN